MICTMAGEALAERSFANISCGRPPEVSASVSVSPGQTYTLSYGGNSVIAPITT